MVDEDRIEGRDKQIKGAMKEAWGKATGDRSRQAEGMMDKAEGKLQEGLGKAQDEFRAAKEKMDERRLDDR